MQPVVMRVVKSGLRGQRAGSAVLSIAVARQSYHCMRCAHMPHHHVLAHHQGLGLGLARDLGLPRMLGGAESMSGPPALGADTLRRR